MSLITSASPWTNDDSGNQKKRIPTMRKTIQKLPPSLNTNIESSEYVSQEQTYQDSIGKSSEAVQENQEMRNTRVNQLINQLSLSENDGNKLADFTPIANPSLHHKGDDHDSSREADSPIIGQTNPLSMPPPQIQRLSSGTNYSANGSDLGNYGNYKRIYENSNPIMRVNNQFSKNGSIGGLSDDKLMEKINYMIHMLEAQQSEKTNNITEEFILYTFLGVFIIFIVDSFTRAGKYIR